MSEAYLELEKYHRENPPEAPWQLVGIEESGWRKAVIRLRADKVAPLPAAYQPVVVVLEENGGIVVDVVPKEKKEKKREHVVKDLAEVVIVTTDEVKVMDVARGTLGTILRGCWLQTFFAFTDAIGQRYQFQVSEIESITATVKVMVDDVQIRGRTIRIFGD